MKVDVEKVDGISVVIAILSVNMPKYFFMSALDILAIF